MDAKYLECTIPFQLTKTIRRDPYGAISPDNKQNSAVGKVVLITGKGTVIGAVGYSCRYIVFRVDISNMMLFPGGSRCLDSCRG